MNIEVLMGWPLQLEAQAQREKKARQSRAHVRIQNRLNTPAGRHVGVVGVNRVASQGVQVLRVKAASIIDLGNASERQRAGKQEQQSRIHALAVDLPSTT